ncbi:MAG: hypothetical protein ACOYB8_06925 [Eubacteriaceae bacterium]
MKLYFGNTVTTVTTVMLVSLILLIVYTYINRASVDGWGRRTLLLAVYGLVICCFAAARDGLDKTIQAAIDGSCSPGIFSLVSFPTIIGCVGAAIIIVSGIVTIFVKKQDVREVLYFVMSGGILLKILAIEITRIFM